MVRFHPGEQLTRMQEPPAVRAARRPLLVLIALMALAAGVAVVVDIRLDHSPLDLPDLRSKGLAEDLVLLWLLTVKPVMAALAAAVVVASWRAGRGLALASAVMILLPNVLVQLVKHASLLHQVMASVNPLSGHAALLSSVCLTWVAVAPARFKLRSAGWAVVALTGTLLGVGAAWHSVLQLVIPLAVSTAVVLAGASTFPTTTCSRPFRVPAMALAVVSAAGALALLRVVPAAAVPPRDAFQIVTPLPALAVLLAVVAAFAAVLAASGTRGLPDNRALRPTGPSRTAAE